MPLISKPVPPATPETFGRFFKNVKQQADGCWMWTGTKGNGYGVFSLNGKPHRAHRVFYAWIFGNPPETETIDHLCRTTLCVNPTHLDSVTGWINVLRGTSPASTNAFKRECINGHPYTPENTRVQVSTQYGTLWRSCKICNQARQKRYTEKMQANRICSICQRRVVPTGAGPHNMTVPLWKHRNESRFTRGHQAKWDGVRSP